MLKQKIIKTAGKIVVYSLSITLIAGIVLVFSDVLSAEVIKVPYSSIALQFVFTIIAIFLLTKGKPGKYGFQLPQKTAFRSIVLWVIILLVLGYFLSMFFEGEQHGEQHPIADKGLLTRIILGLVVAPILEEVVFRGLIQSYLARFKHIGFKIARAFFSYPVIFAALLFSFAHLPMIIRDMNAGLMFIIFFSTYVFCGGILMGYAREKTGSLIPAVIIHFSINLFVLLSDYFLSCN